MIEQGDLDEHEKLVTALSQVDVVISTLAVPQHLEQFKIIKAMKEAGNIKVTIPPFCLFAYNKWDLIALS